MHPSTPLLLLASLGTVTAIDVSLWLNPNCGGPGLVWRNINPTVCCSVSDLRYASARWDAIPQIWTINVGAYRSGGCNALAASRDTNDKASVCIGAEGRVITGAKYTFRNGKRAETESCGAGLAIRGQERREACVPVPPHEVILADGTAYDVVGLEKAAINTLIAFAHNGSNAAVVPTAYRMITAGSSVVKE